MNSFFLLSANNLRASGAYPGATENSRSSALVPSGLPLRLPRKQCTAVPKNPTGHRWRGMPMWIRTWAAMLMQPSVSSRQLRPVFTDDHTRVCCSFTGNRDSVHPKMWYLQGKTVCKEQLETFSLAT